MNVAACTLPTLAVEFAQSKTFTCKMSNPVLYLFTFLAYSVLAVLFWRAQLAGQAEQANRSNIGHAIAIPLIAHGCLLYQNLFIFGSLNIGLVYSISLILWLTVLVYWLARLFYPLANMQAFVLPLAGIGAVLPGIFPEVHKLAQPTSLAFDAHILAAMLAYSLFTIAAFHAGLMSLVEKRLHHAMLPNLMKNLPPLMTMEKLLFRIIAIGLIVLTVTLLSGMIFSEEIFGQPWQLNHKNLFGLLSWVIFSVLLMGRSSRGWRGKIAVRWTMGGFIFLILAYLGTQFVLEIILHR